MARFKQQLALFRTAFSDSRHFVVALQAIASGLVPALIGGSLLQAWVSDAGIDIKTIGLLTGVAMPYTLKFIWSPLLDRFALPMGRRKGWIAITQALLIVATLVMSYMNPATNITAVAVIAIIIATLGATMDTALDAWRVEYVPMAQIPMALSVNTTFYLISFRLLGGALALILADQLPWYLIYQIMAAILAIPLISIFLTTEPKVEVAPPKNFHESVILPFSDFFSRKGAWFLLTFILLYKLGDNMGSALTTKFYLDMTYTKTEIGAVTKVVGWIAISAGTLLGAFAMYAMRIRSALFIFGILQGVSTAAFALLATSSHSIALLTSIIAFENLTAGLGTAAYATLIARLTNKKFTATQYALMTSIMGIPRYLSGMPTGYMVDSMGWRMFFIVCGLVAIPGILLSLRIKEDKTGYITI